MNWVYNLRTSLVTSVFVCMAGVASADSITPLTFSADLAVGESATISKTVVVNEGAPTDALVDVHFLIDTSGSMSGEINAAKAAAAELFDGLKASFGDVAAGVGVFSEGSFLPPDGPLNGRSINQDLTTDTTTFTGAVNNVSLGNPDGGFDRPESGYTAIAQAGSNVSWRAGSNRFMFVFTDADGKGDSVGALAALADEDIDLIVLAYRRTDIQQSTYGNILGADVFGSTTSAEAIIDDVTAGITAGFADYTSVTVGDLDGGLPNIAVSTVCTSADTGACVGAEAVGVFDRSTERTFTFDVTFTRIAAGSTTFDTFALVDGGIVAREFDSFPDSAAVIPVPAALPLLASAFCGFALFRRKRAA
ncbi:vWA domain-containing protein [Rubrimonas cliftonensis]|uniref:VPLPA-CTERM protein sorting domain-containing protein n=1 Tax=Rubrimonas cliftonensis TaxID=89524 RepID=A0A1H3VDM1_9RHOB|nr:vWA domain-containing protein [Rubrimonas cliftonensis]SDZ72903.1 VPLPA-CTERM protein sorting domain-containing protein [Rubrimonas cliftonensis]